MQLHEDQRGQVNNELSEPFLTLSGVKQGCILTPALFTIFSMMFQKATEYLSSDDGMYVRYRTDGSLFKLRCLQAHTKSLEYLVRELLFADDAALVAHTENALQHVTSCFAEAAQLFRLEVSLKKTEVLHKPAPKETYRPPNITVGETELKAVQQFTYLGCTISSDAKSSQSPPLRITAELPLKRSAVGGRTASSQHQPQTRHTTCRCCGRVCLSRIGLVSHQRACTRHEQCS